MSLIRPQLFAIAALVFAAVLGLVRMFTGLGAPAGPSSTLAGWLMTW